MRAFHAIGAAFLMAWLIPVPSHADGTTGASSAAAPGCVCPRQVRRAPHARLHARYWRHRRPVRVAVIPPWPAYNPPLPGLPHFVAAAGGGVFEYDIIAGGYVQLAQRDARRALPVAVPVPPP